MRYATVHCSNPNCVYHLCGYGAAVEDGYMAECPGCRQINRVAGKDMSGEITGLCSGCGKPLDDHLYGRLSFCCPKGKVP